MSQRTRAGGSGTVAGTGRLIAILFGVALAALPSGLSAQTTREQSLELCEDTDPEISIDACTVLIQAGQEKPADLAQIFFNRARSYNSIGDPDRAIQDYGEAIKLDPTLAFAFNNRILLYTAQRNDDQVQLVLFDPTAVH